MTEKPFEFEKTEYNHNIVYDPYIGKVFIINRDTKKQREATSNELLFEILKILKEMK